MGVSNSSIGHKKSCFCFKYHSKSAAGLTMIELMVSVAIVGILAVLAMSNFNDYKIRSFNAEAQTWLRTLQNTYYGREEEFLSLNATLGSYLSTAKLFCGTSWEQFGGSGTLTSEYTSGFPMAPDYLWTQINQDQYISPAGHIVWKHISVTDCRTAHRHGYIGTDGNERRTFYIASSWINQCRTRCGGSDFYVGSQSTVPSWHQP